MLSEIEPPVRAPIGRRATLALAFADTLAASALPRWRFLEFIWEGALGGAETISFAVFGDWMLLLLGLALAASSPRASGLILGRPREHLRGLLLVCGGPVLLCALIYPNLGEHPFADAPWTMWAVSPLAQDLIFLGFLYGLLEAAFPGVVHPRVRVSRALVWTAGFFALWHLPNLATDMSVAFLLFQLTYVMVGLVVVGLSRQWTGSILYATLTHSIVNAIAWSVG